MQTAVRINIRTLQFPCHPSDRMTLFDPSGGRCLFFTDRRTEHAVSFRLPLHRSPIRTSAAVDRFHSFAHPHPADIFPAIRLRRREPHFHARRHAPTARHVSLRCAVPSVNLAYATAAETAGPNRDVSGRWRLCREQNNIAVVFSGLDGSDGQLLPVGRRRGKRKRVADVVK